LSTKLAIFDFDGTLTEGHLWAGLAAYFRSQGRRNPAVYSYLLSHLPVWLASKARLISDERNRRSWGEDIAALLKGLSRKEGVKAFEWVTDNYFRAKMRSDILAALREHARQGCQTLILSGVLTDFLEVVRSRFAVDYVVGTRLELRGDQYTGQIVPPLCFGANKVKLLKEFCAEINLAIDWAESWAYADSIYDLPVLEVVGHPVVTYPDERLYELALRRKWAIIPAAPL